MRILLTLSVILTFVFSSCTKDKKYSKWIEGTWNIDSLHVTFSHSGGSIDSNYVDAGVITFNAEGAGGNMSYEYYDPYSFPIDENSVVNTSLDSWSNNETKIVVYFENNPERYDYNINSIEKNKLNIQRSELRGYITYVWEFVLTK